MIPANASTPPDDNAAPPAAAASNVHPAMTPIADLRPPPLIEVIIDVSSLRTILYSSRSKQPAYVNVPMPNAAGPMAIEAQVAAAIIAPHPAIFR